MSDPNLAHISEDGRTQSNETHMTNVAKKAKAFADAFGCGEEAEMVGLMHDVGKYSAEFQNRLLHDGPKVDHSTAGAYELFQKRDLIGAMCIAGHHSGLMDMGNQISSTAEDGTFLGRIAKVRAHGIPDYSEYRKYVDAGSHAPLQIKDIENIYFFTKMLYSCLVDADFLDTEEFMQAKGREHIESSIEELASRCEEYLHRFDHPTTNLNKVRCQILQQSIEAAATDHKFFSLTVPTGGGKTIASLAFALNYAKQHKKDRIIYVIPYMSIIDQTAAVFNSILGEENILPHYSEYEFDDTDETDHAKRLATENWDSPVVVTTNVQFFESMYGASSSKNRKLHNIANSVVVFDEYQMIPVDYLRPCLRGIEKLMAAFSCCVLLSTATQPGTIRFYKECECHEIIADVPRLFEVLKRVNYRKIGKLTTKMLARSLQAEDQVLCIVNTRKSAQEIYNLLGKGEEGNYHLSTMMVSYDRVNTLNTIRQRLKDGRPCRVVSTSLIEAGVDVDFPSVYREENGLDSIIQSGGRCNREGKHDAKESVVRIFSLEGKTAYGQKQYIDAMIEATYRQEDIAAPDIIKHYFDVLYELRGDEALDKQEIWRMVCEGCETGMLPFRTISEKFRLIDNDTRTVYIPINEESKRLIEKISYGVRTKEIIRKLGKYAVNVYADMFEDLRQADALEVYDDVYVLKDMSLYDADMGLCLA